MGVGATARLRVSLRAVHDDDRSAVHVWYTEAIAAGYDAFALEERWRRAEAAGGLMAIVLPDNDEPIGLIEYQTSEPEDRSLTVSFIALAKAYRGWGYGSEAVRLLEEWAVHEGLAERFRAEVDLRNGLGLYFWLRLGYRPAGRDEEGWRTEGERDRMAMVREVGPSHVERGR